MLHKAVENSPHALFHKRKPNIPQIIAFGQLGTIPIHAPKQKLQARALQVRYSYGISEQLVRVQDIYTGSYHTARAADFVPYHRTMDPTAIIPHAFRITSHTIPTSITPSTPPPATLGAARRYLDATLWAKAHDTELQTLQKQKVFA